uniref:PNPLA domain-containing protein n=1 Tax=Anolis carolinensis TaxID=28377 RepID=A0A803U0B1_ANOCA
MAGKTFTFTLVLTILICMSLWLDLFPLSWTDDVKKCLYGAARDARRTILGPFAPGCSILRILQRRLHQILPENSHRMATGRLYISLTRLMDGKNVVVSEYNSKEELIQHTVDPCHLLGSGSRNPFPMDTKTHGCSHPISYNGLRYVDGGFTNLQPRSDLETAITVSPFTGEIDICPRDCPAIFYSLHIVHGSIQVSIENLCRIGYALFPPSYRVSSSSHMITAFIRFKIARLILLKPNIFDVHYKHI